MAEEDGPSGQHRVDADRQILLEAWLSQRTEWSRSIFTISSAAIGLIVTGVFTAPSRPAAVTLIFLALAALSFCVSSISCISAFEASSKVIGARLHLPDDDDQHAEIEGVLDRLKTLQYHFFVFGLLLLLIAAFTHVTNDQEKPDPAAARTASTPVRR